MYSIATRHEQTIGSINFIIDIMLKSVIIQVIYLVIIYIFSFVLGESVLNIPSYGLWNLVIVYISIKSFSNPEEET
jgi:hypothetical protein